MNGSFMNSDKMLKIGQGYIDLVEQTLSENDISGKILYVSDPIVDKLYGEKVRKQIMAVGRIKEESVDYNTISYAMTVAERVIATDVDCIVGLGGGKVLDVCKYASYISKKPLLSIPTTMANDGIASPIAVLKRKDDKPKSLGCATPKMLLLDTDLILKGPSALIKAGIGDTISNYMALKDWDFACSKDKDVMNGYAYMLSKIAFDMLMSTKHDSVCSDFLEVLANSLVLSGIAMDFAGSSRPVSGSEHLFSHALDYFSKKPNLHGLQVALGTVAVSKLIGDDCGEILDYLHKFEVDVNPKSLEIDKDTFVYCMKHATSMRNRYTHLNEADLSDGKLKDLYDELVKIL